MKITLFYVFVFWTICLITSHKIPPQYFRNTKDVNNLNELEQLLKERTNEGKDQKEAEEARKTSLHTEEEMKEEQENSDDEQEIEIASQGADEREMNDYERIKDPQERLGHKLHTAQTYLDRSGKVNARKTEESMTTFPDKERLLTEKINEWRTTNENEKEDAEELPVDHPENIDPDDPVSNLLEGMEIENNGHPHLVSFLYMFNNMDFRGCWSYVGNVNPQGNNIQYLGLEEPGCISVGTSVHEMLHAIGGKHEQSRADRDNYVTIEWPNVKKSWNGQLQAYVKIEHEEV
ncbi:unnamed protein product [Mytilus edulis]|uniref:Metalloendopeptidase n=1 Tax=Mytilus edulis TaxID=6550 RepID=A0A8S3V1U8_MYTED|nr:unnamed protein product [Mytilus edulis]